MKATLFYVAVVTLFFSCGCLAFSPFYVVRLSPNSNSLSSLKAWNNDKDEATIEEESRLKIWESRRGKICSSNLFVKGTTVVLVLQHVVMVFHSIFPGQIRSVLKNAESLRNFRIKNGMERKNYCCCP